MNHYTLIIDKEQKQIIAKALEKFSEMHLGQTMAEYEAAKKLHKAVVTTKDSSLGTIINNLAG